MADVTVTAASVEAAGGAAPTDDVELTPIPDGHTRVDVPAQIASQLPPLTAFSRSAEGLLVASVIVDGTLHVLSTTVADDLAAVVTIVERYVAGLHG